MNSPIDSFRHTFTRCHYKAKGNLDVSVKSTFKELHDNVDEGTEVFCTTDRLSPYKYAEPETVAAQDSEAANESGDTTGSMNAGL